MAGLFRAAIDGGSRVEALGLAQEREAARVEILADSELVVRQVNGQYRVRHPDLKPLYAEAVRRISSFEQFKISHIPRERNKLADRLVNKALDRLEADPAEQGIRIHEVSDPQ
jgi:ribonuclease HI